MKGMNSVGAIPDAVILQFDVDAKVKEKLAESESDELRVRQQI
jgi:hypothetical protein